MLSNLFRSLTILTISLALGGCDYFLNRVEPNPEVSYQLEAGSCLNNSNSIISHFFDENKQTRLAQSDFDYLGECYSEAIDAIIQYTRSGRVEANNFSAENIEILIKRLYPDVSLTQETVTKYFHIKHFLIGGSLDSLSKDELNYIRLNFVPAVVEAFKSLNDSRIIILKGFRFTERDDKFERNEENFRNFQKVSQDLTTQVNSILDVLDQRNGQREITVDQIVNLLSEEFESENLMDYLGLVQAFKNLALNQEGSVVRRRDLRPLLQQSLLAYQVLAQFRYFMLDEGIFNNIGTVVSFLTRVPTLLKDSSVFRGVALRSLLDIYEIIGNFFVNSAQRADDAKINFDRVEEVSLQLEATGVLSGEGLSATTLNQFVRRLSRKWFPTSDGIDSSLTLEKISYIKSVVFSWVERQQIVNSLFEGDSGQEVDLRNLRDGLDRSPIVQSWIRLFESVSLHQWEPQYRVAIYQSGSNHLSYEDLVVSNSQWLLLELFMKPYNLDKAHAFDFAITSDQAQEAYELLRILGIEMGFMDSREYRSGHRTFQESNNFSTQMRNDSVMDFFESYEYLSVAFSSGPLSEVVHGNVSQSCYLDYQDVLFTPVIRADCYRPYIRNQFERFYSHLTSIGSYWREAGAEERENFINSLEIASRGGVISQKPFDMGEIRVMSSVLYYLQSVFYTFDANHDDKISGQELRRAESHFRDMIIEFILDYPGLDDLIEQIDSYAWVFTEWNPDLPRPEIARLLSSRVFIFLLERGHLPETTGEKVRFLRLLNPQTLYGAFNSMEAQVPQVLSVFSAIAVLTHQSQLDNIQQFLKTHREDLIAEISQPEVPACPIFREESSVFCRWARIISCNEPINTQLFMWMRENRFSLFPEIPGSQGRERSIQQTIDQLSLIMRSHTSFSTQCNFPEVVHE